jgi:hypothetical protein
VQSIVGTDRNYTTIRQLIIGKIVEVSDEAHVSEA